MTNSSYNRYAAIDTLRGLAALFVLWHHTAEEFIIRTQVVTQGNYLADLFANVDLGRIGIICFFLISGFVIPHSLKYSHKKPVRTFIRRRFFRLYPVYWLSLLTMVLFLYYKNNVTDVSVIAANITMIQSVFGQPHVIGLYWTLQVELIFYILCVLLFIFRLLESDRLLFVLITVFFVIFVATQILLIFYGIKLGISKEFQLLPYLLGLMFLGSFIRKWHDGKLPATAKCYTLICLGLYLGLPLFLIISAMLGFEFTDADFRFGISHTIGIILFIAGLYLFKKINKVFIWFGIISYSVYLFHPIIMKLVSQYMNNYTGIEEIHLLLPLIAVTVLTLLVASIVYKLLEKPMITIGHKS